MAHHPIPSKAAIKGHPLHPIVIPYPIALATAAVFSDVAFWLTGARAWAVASAWLLWAAFATGVVAAAVGAVDYFGLDAVREHRAATQHAVGNVVALIVVLGNAVLRLVDLTGAVLPWGLVLSLLAGAVIGVTGYLGGELSYKHMIGVNPRQTEPESPLLGSRR